MTTFWTAVNGGALSLVALLEVTLVICALAVTTTGSVSQAVKLYQWQSLALALATFLSVVMAVSNNVTSYLSDPQKGREALFLIFLVPLLPAVLIVTIRPLLHRATLATDASSTIDDLKMLLVAVIGPWLTLFARRRRQRRALSTGRSRLAPRWLGRIERRMIRYGNLERDAETLWQDRQSIRTHIWAPILFIVLLLIAVLVAFSVPTKQFDPSARVGLAVSLMLNLVGLYNMISKQDIISQVIGLLIMDQGLYLAVVNIVAIPVPATFFVISLYFYTLITVFILLILLPKIRETAHSIDLTEIARESDLKSS